MISISQFSSCSICLPRSLFKKRDIRFSYSYSSRLIYFQSFLWRCFYRSLSRSLSFRYYLYCTFKLQVLFRVSASALAPLSAEKCARFLTEPFSQLFPATFILGVTFALPLSFFTQPVSSLPPNQADSYIDLTESVLDALLVLFIIAIVEMLNSIVFFGFIHSRCWIGKKLPCSFFFHQSFCILVHYLMKFSVSGLILSQRTWSSILMLRKSLRMRRISSPV